MRKTYVVWNFSLLSNSLCVRSTCRRAHVCMWWASRTAARWRVCTPRSTAPPSRARRRHSTARRLPHCHCRRWRAWRCWRLRWSRRTGRCWRPARPRGTSRGSCPIRWRTSAGWSPGASTSRIAFTSRGWCAQSQLNIVCSLLVRHNGLRFEVGYCAYIVHTVLVQCILSLYSTCTSIYAPQLRMSTLVCCILQCKTRF